MTDSKQTRQETLDQLRRERFGDAKSLERERPQRPSDKRTT